MTTFRIGLCLTLCALSSLRATDISFTLAKPGQVSAAIYDNEGRLLRSLAHGRAMEAGEQRLAWDGLDANGRAMPAGDYEWRVLRNDGLQAEYLVSIGANPGWAAHGMWVGSHGPVSAVALDAAQDRLYVGALSGENCPVFQCTSLDGKTLHWQSEQLSSFKGASRLAVSKGVLYLLQTDAWLYALDPKAPSKELAKKWDVVHPNDVRDSTKLAFLPPGHEPGGLAVHEKFIAISHPANDAIRWHDPESLTLLREQKLPGVRGIAVLGDGTLIAAAGAQVWRIAFPDGKPEPMLKDDSLTSAANVAVDEARDELWIAEAKTAHTIRRFKLSTGARTLQLGSKDGRPFGKFDPLHWRDVSDIVCDGKGGLITVEATPRRVAHLAIENDQPRLINQWFGGQQWGNMAAIDPDDPSIAYVNASSYHRARVRMDFTKRTWTLDTLYDSPSWLTRKEGKTLHDGPFPSITHHDAQWQVMHRAGQTYLVSLGGNAMSHAPAVVRVDEQHDRFVPVACAGVVRMSAEGKWPAWFEHLPRPSTKHRGRAPVEFFGYSWSDVNGDGEMQDSEFRVTTAPAIPGLGHGSMDAQWNVTLPSSTPAGNEDQPIGLILKNLSDANATPQWDWTVVEPTREKLPTDIARLSTISVAALHRDDSGALTALIRANHHPNDDRQGNAWPGNTVGTARILRYDAQGKPLFVAGKHGSVNDIAPGEFQYPKRIMAVAKGCVIIQDRAVRIGQAWTTDGLYAGSFLDRHADDGLPVDQVYRAALASHGVENFLFDQIGGSVVTASNGDMFWNPVGRNSSPIYRIHGWDNWERQSGRVKLADKAQAASQTGSGLRGSYFTNTEWQGPAAHTRTDAQLWFGNRQLSFAQDQSGRPWLDAANAPAFDLKNFSARWEGRLEPLLSEDYQLIIEHDAGSTVRLWLDDKLILESQALEPKANRRAPTKAPVKVPPARQRRGKQPPQPDLTQAKTLRLISKPIPMSAGKSLAIRIDYASPNNPEPQMPQLHLNWESFTQERQHVPTTALTAD
jgi:hypothetical protein